MKRGISSQPSRAKSVLLKSSWAVVIEWVCNRVLGFDRDIILLLHLSNRRAWLRWYVYSPFCRGFSALCSRPPLVCKPQKTKCIFKGLRLVLPLKMHLFCFIIILKGLKTEMSFNPLTHQKNRYFLYYTILKKEVFYNEFAI